MYFYMRALVGHDRYTHEIPGHSKCLEKAEHRHLWFVLIDPRTGNDHCRNGEGSSRVG